jgi:hypothetical protein
MPVRRSLLRLAYSTIASNERDGDRDEAVAGNSGDAAAVDVVRPVLERLSNRDRHDDGDDDDNNNNNNNNDTTASSGIRASRQYRLVRTSLARLRGANSSSTTSMLPTSRPSDGSDSVGNIDFDVEDIDDDDDDDIQKEEMDKGLTVVILDFTQKKFRINHVDISWNVKKLKQLGYAIHQVPVSQQRLIFRGQLLEDDKLLSQYSGFHTNDNEVIVHLFPKPRVVITTTDHRDESDTTASTDIRAGSEHHNSSTIDPSILHNTRNGASIPTIVLNTEEVERRSSILVLGSAEYIEAVNNIKMFSFMLLFISSMELFNLLGVAMGVPEDTQGAGMDLETNPIANNELPLSNLDDDAFPQLSPTIDEFHDNSDDMYQNGSLAHNSTSLHPDNQGTSSYGTSSDVAWTGSHTVDMFVSIIGVYTALLGMKASNENTLRVARQYLQAVFVAGTSWLAYNFFITYHINEEVEEHRRDAYDDDTNFPSMTSADVFSQAMSVMILPAMLWLLCCARAFQFQNLLREAEEEAATRMLPTDNVAVVDNDAANQEGISTIDLEQNQDGLMRSTSIASVYNNNNTRAIMTADPDP